MTSQPWDAIILGGGFYGCALGAFLKQQRRRVLLVEAGSDLMLRASYANQARIHAGYHYPRSFMTAWRSSINFPRFVTEYADCVDRSFEKIYAVARRGSRVSAYQFKAFCRNIGAPLRPAPPALRRLFNPDLIAAVFIAPEFAFNAVRLREHMRQRLAGLGVPILFNTAAQRIAAGPGGRLRVTLSSGDAIQAGAVFNCTYARLNTLLRQSALPLLPLKHEITELALIEAPPDLRGLGVTVMDGPFFSAMPFPAEGLHSLSHVRYTPHEAWADSVDGYRDPYACLAGCARQTRVGYMLRDAQRYLPALAQARYVRSLFEVKTVLLANEVDDGRPILCRAHHGLPNLYVVLGAKMDNIYDVMQHLARTPALAAASMAEAVHEPE